MLIVDAHHHLWDTTAREYPWMDGPWADPLRGRFDTVRLAAATKAYGVAATVVVQAVADEAETRELLAAAAESDLVSGVVGWVDLTAPDIADRLAALREASGGAALRGIRHQVQDEPDPAWLLRPEVRLGLRAVGKAGLVYELLIKAPQLAAAVRTVWELPEISFVLDHLGKPQIALRTWRPWADGLAALAQAGNVTAKLSGLVTEADWTSWRPEQFLPYTRHALEVLGPDRLMFGSDWPVCALAASYAQVVQIAEAAVADLSADERAAVFGGTARQVYQLEENR